jgi:hypothetical protein
MRTFRQIMRDAYLARKSGMSASVALMSACGDDDDWNVIFERLMSIARLERSLKRFTIPTRRKERPAVMSGGPQTNGELPR